MLKKIVLLALVASSIFSCDISRTSSSTCPVIIGVATSAVSGPFETAVDVPVTLQVSYTTKANCGGFKSFYNSASIDPLVEIVTVNVEYDACSCDEVESVQSANYTFKKSVPGLYVVKFRETNETFVEHSILVQ